MRNYPTPPAPSKDLAPLWGRPDQNLMQPRRETESTQQVSCDVVFGSPSANCMGTGICRISARTASSPASAEQKRDCQSTVGLMFPIEGGSGMAMVLTRALLCAQLYKAHLRHGTLRLESPCPLPEEITRTLGLKIGELTPGDYPIQSAEGFLRIDFIK
ncbi:MAG: hypothetical protein ACKVUS_14930 [Saprospiraceae bacterium]